MLSAGAKKMHKTSSAAVGEWDSIHCECQGNRHGVVVQFEVFHGGVASQILVGDESRDGLSDMFGNGSRRR
jgi:hypothetical protein